MIVKILTMSASCSCYSEIRESPIVVTVGIMTHRKEKGYDWS